MFSKDPAKLMKVSVKLPWVEAEWMADPAERAAAWSLYVELITRIGTQPLDPDHGLVSEALASLYKIFDITRQILREAGPAVGARRESVGGISITVLNKGLRPFLAKWHYDFDRWMSSRPTEMTIYDHERAWVKDALIRGELQKLRQDIERYADALAQIAGVKNY